MKKKSLFSIIGLLIATSVFCVTAFAALANNSGYEKIKNAFFDTLALNNMTLDVAATYEYDGVVLNNSKQLVKKDGDLAYIQLEDKGRDSAETFKHSYYNSDINLNNISENERKFIALLIDSLTGDTKNYVITDGNKVTLNLDEQQVPLIAQMGVAVIAENVALKINDPNFKMDRSSINGPFELKDLVIKNISAEGEIDEKGYLKYVNFSMEIGGNDTDKSYHTSKFDLKVNFSDIGTTNVVYDESLIY